MKKQQRRILGLLLVTIFGLGGCGGHRLPVQNPAALGVVPFAAEGMAPLAAELNQKLIHSLHSSGRFRVVLLQNNPRLLNLQDFQQFATNQLPADTLTDSTLAQPRNEQTLPRWILTGIFLREQEWTDQGTVVPFTLYAPSRKIIAELEYRIYDTAEKRWIDIRNIHEIKKHRGKWQVIDPEPNDPSLMKLAAERQQWRNALYEDLFKKLSHELERVVYEN
jgi:hypothetical protein